MKAIEAEPRTLIFYESTHRLLDSLEDMVAVWGESRYVVLARELTKTWETIHGAPVGELLAWVKEDENRRKGEMVLIVEGLLPFASPVQWRRVFEELLKMQDGQIRFVGLISIVCGLLMLAVLAG